MSVRAHGLSLRWRLTLVGLVGVAVALAIGSLVLYAVLNLAGQRALDDTARNTADDVVALVERGTIPEPLPVSGAQQVQVVDGKDRVIGAAGTSDRLTSLLRPHELARARAGQHLTVPGTRVGITAPLRVVARPVTAPTDGTPDQSTVVVAVQAGDYQQAQSILRRTLLVTYPLLLAALGLLSWWVIGRTLRPVERLRAGAETIGGTGRDERLPVPQSADEIRALAQTLNQMLDRLTAARERQRDFVADAAHELRSPLASMRTQLEVAQRLGEGGGLPADLLADVSRLSGLVEDLLLLARLERAPTSATARDGAPVPVDLPALLREVSGRHTDARVPVVVVDVAGGAASGAGLTVAADPDHLRRVLTNLVDNAVRHADSRVELSCLAEADRADRAAGAILVVSDDGPGIPADRRERVFERFARLDDARNRDAGGSGLGLAIVSELVARLGGEVSLADARAGTVESPATEFTSAESSRAASSRAASSPTAGPGLRVEVRLPRSPARGGAVSAAEPGRGPGSSRPTRSS